MAAFRLSAILGLLMLLAGCIPNSVSITCPSLIRYSPEFQKAALLELNAIKAPHLEQILSDYSITRDAIRACIKRRDAR